MKGNISYFSTDQGQKTCEDVSQICCFKDSIKVPEAPKESQSGDYDYYGEESIPCESLARDGYR